MVLRVGIIGAGLQGRRRASVFNNDKESRLVVISSAKLEESMKLADEFGCESSKGWEEVVLRKDLNAIIICTPPHLHALIAIEALKTGKHVLCEKPLAKTYEEGCEMIRTAKEYKRILKCGFNHRHHPAISKAKKMFDDKKIGNPIFARACYGICGRPDCMKEWRSDPSIAAGGHLMEQGIHSIDLFRWFFGDFSKVTGVTQNGYWKTQPLEDNGYAILQTENNVVCTVHASLTQWRNRFSFEVFGTDGYLSVEGLGGSYGTEKLIYGKRDFFKPFSEEITEFLGEDKSWYLEWAEFTSSIKENRQPMGNGEDGLAAMEAVNAVYQASLQEKTINLKSLESALSLEGRL